MTDKDDDRETDRLLVDDIGARFHEKQQGYASVSSDSNNEAEEGVPPPPQEEQGEDMPLFTITAILSTSFSCKLQHNNMVVKAKVFPNLNCILMFFFVTCFLLHPQMDAS